MSSLLITIITVGFISLLFGILISILDKKLKIEEDPLLRQVKEILPGINCGACGFPSCEGLAKWLIENKNTSKKCIPGGEEVNKKISEILGLELSPLVSKKIIVLCGAHYPEKKRSFEYVGPLTCNCANLTQGNIDCKYGCLGLGDCVNVCPTYALKIKDGLVYVDYKKCIGCGKCVDVCPRKILKLVEVKNDYLIAVSCNNSQEPQEVKSVCKKGCIGCGLCVKLIKDSPFFMEGYISRVDFDKLDRYKYEDIKVALEKCPVKIINKFDV